MALPKLQGEWNAEQSYFDLTRFPGQAVAPTTLTFGFIQGVVSFANQIHGVLAILRKQRDPNTDARTENPFPHADWVPGSVAPLANQSLQRCTGVKPNVGAADHQCMVVET